MLPPAPIICVTQDSLWTFSPFILCSFKILFFPLFPDQTIKQYINGVQLKNLPSGSKNATSEASEHDASLYDEIINWHIFLLESYLHAITATNVEAFTLKMLQQDGSFLPSFFHQPSFPLLFLPTCHKKVFQAFKGKKPVIPISL